MHFPIAQVFCISYNKLCNMKCITLILSCYNIRHTKYTDHNNTSLLFSCRFASTDDLAVSTMTERLSLNQTSSLFQDPDLGLSSFSDSLMAVQYHLVSKDAVMSWRRPQTCCVYLTWHRGAALEVCARSCHLIFYLKFSLKQNCELK